MNEPAPERKASFGATMKAVFWSFFGVRKSRDHAHDAANLNPLHIVVAALIGVVIFIGVLVMLVKIAVAQ
jgi:amino acid transporter